MKEATVSFGFSEESELLNKHNPDEPDPNKFHYTHFPNGKLMTKQNIKTGQMWVYAGRGKNKWVDVRDCDRNPLLFMWGVPRSINGETIW